MKILLTGASSFTGYWFASALASAGHQVVAPLLGRAAAYEGVRKERVERLAACSQVIESCSFGGERFLRLIEEGIDVLCHHAAQASGYKSPDFDVCAAVQSNTLNLRSILRSGKETGLKAVVLTGSVFEPDEGAGTEPRRAFSPYGLSKGLTAQVFRFWCAEFAVPLAKFVIPNPFGPWEEERFCAYLMRCWAQDKVAVVTTPAYVRDNIHVSLLARVYADFVGSVNTLPAFSRLAPSGYAESQGAFAQRFAREIGERLGLRAALSLERQTEYPEPPVRINTSIPDAARLGWNEERAWQELAEYYRVKYLSNMISAAQ